MLEVGAIISYDEMARQEGRRLQKGMNVQRGRRNSVSLMSRRKNAPYEALAVKSAPERWVWTLVDISDREKQAMPGIHWVNRQGYFICDVARPDDCAPVGW